ASKIYSNALRNKSKVYIQFKLVKIVLIKRGKSAAWCSRLLDRKLNLSRAQIPLGFTIDDVQNAINATNILSEFRKFMLTKKFSASYDHAIGFTRMLVSKVVKLSNGKLILVTQDGTAYHSLKGFGNYHGQNFLGICRGFGFSVISDRMSTRTQFILAHELGHSLGLSHDGHKINDDTYCDPNHNYLMTPVFKLLPSTPQKLRQNAFHLSKCSIMELEQMLLHTNGTIKRDAFCLQKDFKASEENYIQKFPGQDYSANWQCKMWGGMNASFCVNLTNDICTLISCRYNQNAKDCIYLSSSVLDGTSCGIKMWCDQGQCVSHDDAPEECLWGDAVPDCFRIHHMRRRYRNPRRLCSMTQFRETCCETCKDYSNVSKTLTRNKTIEGVNYLKDTKVSNFLRPRYK
ncbi:hypothetical protein GJ496_006675, partial [Pomphorhynchus laevis]